MTQPEDRSPPTPDTHSGPAPWHFSASGIALRLFLTCWLVYVLHFATDIVREVYPALALVEEILHERPSGLECIS